MRKKLVISCLVVASTLFFVHYGYHYFSQKEQTEISTVTQSNPKDILKTLSKYPTLKEKVRALKRNKTVVDSFHKFPELQTFIDQATYEEQYVLCILVALHQFDEVFRGFDSLSDKQAALTKLSSTLVETERFYQPLGGLLGYHDTVLSLLLNKECLPPHEYVPPPVEDIRIKTPTVWKTIFDGFKSLPKVGHVFVLGGAGDRLKLFDPNTKEPLPAARLTFFKKSLFERLMQDTEAMEYWYYRSFNRQISTPILIMTSMEKHNDEHIQAMLDASKWYGKNPDHILRVMQPLVPVIDTEGEWLVSNPLELIVKPGGHGVFWKLAQDKGGLNWLKKFGVDYVTIRQVNNPLSATDHTLPSLIGYGTSHQKAFGFASCPSKPGLSEGMNVVMVQKKNNTTTASISNIEYTQFSALKTSNPELFKEGFLPANTNVLLAHIPSIEKALQTEPLPGLIVNAKTPIEITRNGTQVKKIGGRLESSIQNIADVMRTPIDETHLPNVDKDSLSTFLVLQDRDKLISVAKKAYQEGQNPQETPQSCLYDYDKMTRKLLREYCEMTVPKDQSLEEFLMKPSCTIQLHPAMGPLWEVIGQKISKGTISEGSELDLEIAEIFMHDLFLDGSLRIIANQATGPLQEHGRVFSDKVGRAFFKNVTVRNKGAKTKSIEAILEGNIQRDEECSIILEGFSEVVAENVTLDGSFSLRVPDGKRATICQDSNGNMEVLFETITEPSWQYHVQWEEGKAPCLLL